MSVIRQQTAALLFQSTTKRLLPTCILRSRGHLALAQGFEALPETQFRQISTSSSRQASNKGKAAVEYLNRITLGPRFPQGPTVEALKIVVKTLEANERSHTKDIYKYIHENFVGEKFEGPEPRPQSLRMGKGGVYKAQIPDPEHPRHPVRSIRYLKVVLLEYLEAHGRVRKIVVKREATEEDMVRLQKVLSRKKKRGTASLEEATPTLVNDWVWELIPPKAGTIPIEERQWIPQKESDRIYFQRLQERESAISDPFNDGQERGIVISENSEEPSEESIKTHFLGEELAAKWRENTRKDRQYTFKHGARIRGRNAPGDKIRWNDEENRTEKRIEARKRIFADEYGKPRTTTRAVGFVSTTPPVDFGSKNQKKPEAYRKPLDSNFPEWKQPKQGENDIPFSLKDPRRREVGFNYGLPKQKKLLKAANARGYDQEEWKYQPPRDLTHLSRRRHHARDKQGIKHTAQLKGKDRPNPRTLPSSTELVTINP